MEKNETLKNLSILLSAMKEDHLGKADFSDAFKKVIDYIKKIEKRNIDELAAMGKALDEAKTLLDKKTSDNFGSLKSNIENNLSTSTKNMLATIGEKISELNDRMNRIRDGKDADEEKIIDKVLKKIEIPTIEELKNDLPVMGEEVRDSLELLQDDDRLDVSAIKGIEKIIRDLIKKYAPAPAVGGLRPAGTGIETPTGTINGVNTAFTVSFVPEFITRNGQAIYSGYGYTLSSSSGVLTITMENAPETGDILRSHYKEL